MLHLKLTIKIAYDKGDTSVQELVKLLEDIPNRSADEGLFSGETDAIVEEWDSEVEVVADNEN